jgi:DNA repair ATPase RecN
VKNVSVEGVVTLSWIRKKAFEKLYKEVEPTQEDIEMIKKWFEIKKKDLKHFRKLGKEKVVKNILDDLAMAKKFCEIMGVKV